MLGGYILPYGGKVPINKHRKIAGAVYGWLRRQICAMGNRATVFVCIDANAKVGLVRETGIPHLVCSHNDDYPNIGPIAPERENVNGTLLREFCELMHLQCLNTYYDIGPTYYGMNNTSRPDYIISHTTIEHRINKMFLLK